MHWATKIARDSALEALVFNGIAGGLAIGALLVLGGDIVSDFGIVLLLESVALMLVGGALDLTTSGSARATVRQLRLLVRAKVPELENEVTPEQRRNVGTSAATYAITGLLLFAETGFLALAYL